MSIKNRFIKTSATQHSKLKLAISALLASTTFCAGNALAQDSGQLEEVVVTGIRGSLQRSMDIKRDAIGVVDAISAEDMGKFPDNNLAESLQRITGVSIDRVNGEGSQVTVRGFGAQYNTVTMNGRALPGGFTYGGGSGAGGTQGGATRSFDFANLASESVAGVEVYKTGRADVASGGIGASVNIKTTRPFDNPGIKASVSGKYQHDTTVANGADWTPEVSGLFSWSNDTFGVSLSGSYSKRDSSIAGAAENNWNIGVWDSAAIANNENNMYSWTHDGTGAITATIENAPEDGQLYARPNDFRWAFSERKHERVNGQATFQYRPIDEVTMTLDYTYAESDYKEHRGEWTIWFANGSSADHVIFDDSPVATPIYIHEQVYGKDMGYEQQLRVQKNTLDSTGLNIEWDITDTLNMTFDYSTSTMKNQPNGPGGSGSIQMSVGAPVGTTQWVYFDGDMPVGNFTWDDDGYNADGTPNGTRGNANGILDTGDFGTQQGRVWYAAQTLDIDEARLDATWQLSDALRLDFGLENRSMSMNQKNSVRQVDLGQWGVTNPGELDTQSGYSYLYMFSLADQYDDYDMSRSFPSGVRAFDVEQLCHETVGLYGQTQAWSCDIERNYQGDNDVDEDINSVYVQAGYQFELGGMPANILAGVRFEQTDLTSTSRVRLPLYRVWQDNNDFQVTVYDDAAGIQPYVVDNDYDNTLPSVDFDINFTDSLKGRLSYSKTMARPDYGSLYATAGNFSQTDPTYYINSQPTATAQNPMLIPLESTNIDLSVEWYYGDASYLSVGYYSKDVDNFISTGQELRTLYGMRDASNGPRVRRAAQALLDMGVIVDNTSLFVMTAVLDNPADFPNGAADFVVDATNSTIVDANFAIDVAAAYDVNAILSGPDADPEALWLTSQPSNSEKAAIDGGEIAVQHFFGDTGFGIQANYTTVNGDVSFNDLALPTEEQFALLGLSDTANVVLIYEKFGWSARLAYNWRDEFLRQTNQGGSKNPVYVDEYAQIDLSVSYDVTDSINVFFEGLNLNEENVRWRTRSKLMTQYVEDLGARYSIGARFAF